MKWRAPRRGKSIRLRLIKVERVTVTLKRTNPGSEGKEEYLVKIYFGSTIPPKEFILGGIASQMFIPALLMITKYGKCNTCLACRLLIIDFLLLLVFAI